MADALGGGGGNGTNRVGHEEMLGAANQLEELMNQAVSVLQRYEQHSSDLQAQKMLTGDAGDTNVVTAGEIHQAQMKVQNRWGQLIDTLRSNTHGYINQDSQNASHLASVPGGLRYT